MTSAEAAVVVVAPDDELLVDGCAPAPAVELDDPHAASSTTAAAATTNPTPRNFTRWLLTRRPLSVIWCQTQSRHTFHWPIRFTVDREAARSAFAGFVVVTRPPARHRRPRLVVGAFVCQSRGRVGRAASPSPFSRDAPSRATRGSTGPWVLPSRDRPHNGRGTRHELRLPTRQPALPHRRGRFRQRLELLGHPQHAMRLTRTHPDRTRVELGRAAITVGHVSRCLRDALRRIRQQALGQATNHTQRRNDAHRIFARERVDLELARQALVNRMVISVEHRPHRTGRV
jgi:hypothetical protein